MVHTQQVEGSSPSPATKNQGNEGKIDVSRGGKRPGAGRKAGLPNKRSEATVAQAVEAGDRLPLTIIMDFLNGREKVWRQKLGPDGLPMYVPKADKDDGMEAVMEFVPVDGVMLFNMAIKASPYYHSRRQSILPPDEPPDMSHLSNDDIRRLIDLEREKQLIVARARRGLPAPKAGR